MSTASISGTISPKGYLHVKYDTQIIDGKQYTPYDIVIMPKDEEGTVSFTLPQGIRASIDGWSGLNGTLEFTKVVTVPKTNEVALADLLK
jgi:hypothetical protein